MPPSMRCSEGRRAVVVAIGASRDAVAIGSFGEEPRMNGNANGCGWSTTPARLCCSTVFHELRRFGPAWLRFPFGHLTHCYAKLTIHPPAIRASVCKLRFLDLNKTVLRAVRARRDVAVGSR